VIEGDILLEDHDHILNRRAVVGVTGWVPLPVFFSLNNLSFEILSFKVLSSPFAQTLAGAAASKAVAVRRLAIRRRCSLIMDFSLKFRSWV
jgi:hypothetical protein